ncbi:MAG: hypothetical protein Aurels2KO_31120 [Aureliella sp.]
MTAFGVGAGSVMASARFLFYCSTGCEWSGALFSGTKILGAKGDFEYESELYVACHTVFLLIADGL